MDAAYITKHACMAMIDPSAISMDNSRSVISCLPIRLLQFFFIQEARGGLQRDRIDLTFRRSRSPACKHVHVARPSCARGQDQCNPFGIFHLRLRTYSLGLRAAAGTSSIDEPGVSKAFDYTKDDDRQLN
ncbi:hypothetical protein SEVIR_3G011000v4 [Setaria viridis]|uniref:Uncharacterized protein n=2 Tax=Setaria TaxID=4554 RepID=A0A368QA62_SETIT|nr:hypothetical protein SETIT_3G009800v2 [Setaria italica]TKW23804.1 hypothetical protein SEVIR_3G011000v2 [Setaria viridis]